MEHPPYSLDKVLNDFRLFSKIVYLKQMNISGH
jgi:hypothetical protein